MPPARQPTEGVARCMRASCVPSSAMLQRPPRSRHSITMKLPARPGPLRGPKWNTSGTVMVPVAAVVAGRRVHVSAVHHS